MSSDAIARWNAIPMVREDQAQQPLKRSRSKGHDEDDESEDNVSLVSRSPSPSRDPASMDLDKYDEYVRGAEREVVTVNTRLKSNNKGFAMLANMGWVEGQPLGLSGDGRTEPIPFYVKNDLTGLGKSSQDVRMIETTVSQRRELDSERQTKETEEQRRAREDTVAKKVALQSEILSSIKAFYCELCDKQFQTVAQYDEHTNSYAHHHKARFRDMQAAQRASRNTQEELDKRKEKERKREEKELRKLAKAAGIKLAKPPALTTEVSSDGTESQAKANGFKKSGWATVGQESTSASPDPPTGTAPPSERKSGWATVGPAPNPPVPTAAPAESSPTPRPANSSPAAAPSFRTGGWTSLDTGSLAPAPYPPVTAAPPSSSPHPPPPPSEPPSAPFQPPPPISAPPYQPAMPPAMQTTREGPNFVEPPRGWKTNSFSPSPSQFTGSSTAPKHAPSQPPPTVPPAPVQQEASRSGWKNFKAGTSGRRK